MIITCSPTIPIGSKSRSKLIERFGCVSGSTVRALPLAMYRV